MYIWFTIHIATVSYQYMSYLFYHKIHLLRFIFWYCTSIYNEYIMLLCFVWNHCRTLLIPKISNEFLCNIFKHNILLQISKSKHQSSNIACSYVVKSKTFKYIYPNYGARWVYKNDYPGQGWNPTSIFFQNWMQWWMTDSNHTSKFIIAYYYVVKTDKYLVHIAQLDLEQFMKIIDMFRVGTPQPFLFKNCNTMMHDRLEPYTTL